MNSHNNENGQTILNLISKLCPKNRVRMIKFFILLPIIGLFLTVLYGYVTVHELKSHHESIVNFITKTKKDLITGTIIENCKQAKMRTEDVKHEIVSELKLAYNDLDDMREDYLSKDPETPFYQILSTAISSKFINMDSDRNRMFISNRDYILLDNSRLYSQFSFTEWEEYFRRSSHEKFSRRAIKLIQEQNDVAILWVDNEFEINVSGYDWDPAYDLPDFIAERVLENNITEMYSFSVMITSYIFQHHDIFGVSDVTGGQSNHNDKLYITQIFSLKDMFDNTPHLVQTLEHYDTILLSENIRYEEQLRFRTVLTVLSLLVQLMVFFGLWVLVEYYTYSQKTTEKINNLY